jgi:outer membrane protein assembly factor BamB
VDTEELLKYYRAVVSKPISTCKSYNQAKHKVRQILAQHVLIENDNEFFLTAPKGNSLNAARCAYEIFKLVEKPPPNFRQDVLASLINFPIANLFQIIRDVYPNPKKRKGTEHYSDRFKLCKELEAVHGQSELEGMKFSPGLYSEWSIDLEKCIDATPVIANAADRAVIYIGSHSGLFVAIDLLNGTLIWECRVPDRIESSAAVVNELVVFGCYDHHIYALDQNTGQIRSSFETTGQVKCSPTVDPVTLQVWIGCHGNTLYCLDYSLKNIEKFKIQLDHAIYASICITAKRVFCCTTGGFVYCITKEGNIEWYNQPSGKPIFSSPISHNDSLIAATVDGQIYILKHTDGSIIRNISIDGPIFCTPRLLRIEEEILCVIGTHSSNLHIFNIQKPNHTSVKFDSAIFASSAGNTEIITVSIQGQIKCHSVSADTACVELWTRHIPGMIFSTPVLVNDFLLQASRDNTITLFRTNG